VGLKRYLAQKTVYALLSLLAVTLFCFVIFQVLPPLFACPGIAQAQCVGSLYVPTPPWALGTSLYSLEVQSWGFLQPVTIRLLLYFRDMLTFNFGYNTGSLYRSQGFPLPVLNTIEQTLPFTLFLLASSTIMAVVIGTGLATIAGMRRGKTMDVSLQAVSALVLSLPVFFLGGLVESGVALMTPPSIGPACCYRAPRFVLDFGFLKALALPFATLTLVGVCCVYLLQRRPIMKDSGQEYLLLARAKGSPERDVLFKHALRSGGIPSSRTFVIGLGFILSATVMIETVFNWPGLGQALFMGEITLDLPLEQAVFFVFAVIMIVAKYLFDIVRCFLDPRIAAGLTGD